MSVLGLDCSGRLVGWAVLDADGAVVESGTNEFKSRRGEAVGLIYLRFRKWLADLLDTLGEGVIVAYEQAHTRGGYATEMAVAMQTRAQEMAAERGLIAVPCHTATVKKFATGRGNADKDAMVAAAREVLGRDPVDDNEADAVHIARWAFDEYWQRSNRMPKVAVAFVGEVGNAFVPIAAWLLKPEDTMDSLSDVVGVTSVYAFDLFSSKEAFLAYMAASSDRAGKE